MLLEGIFDLILTGIMGEDCLGHHHVEVPASWRTVLLAAIVLTFMFARIFINPTDPRPPSVIFVETICAAALVTIVLFGSGGRYEVRYESLVPAD